MKILEWGVELFPHLYTALPTGNVNNQFFMKKNADGEFQR